MARHKKADVARLADSRRDAAAHASDRYVDLQLDVLDEATGDLITRFGGRWDRRTKDFVGDAPMSRVIRLHPGQVDAARWFDEWLAGYISGTTPPESKVFDVLAAGGRRGGKTAWAVTEACGFAVAVPDSIVWLCAPSETYYEELIAYVEAILPRSWYESLGWPHWTYFLPNGSRIVLRSGFKPGKLKKGRADLIVVNEGQQLVDQSYTTLSASVIDQGGLVMIAANPPDVGDPGEWIAKLAAEAQRGQRKHARFFFFDPILNPHIDQVALEAMREKMGEHEFNVQIRGMFLLSPDTVLHAWDSTKNEAPRPQIGDCTAAFTKFFENQAFDQVLAVDVQNFPWTCGVMLKAFRNPIAPDDMERAFLWGIDEFFVEKGDEVMLAHAVKAAKYNPERTLLVVDASADWQQAVRDKDRQRTVYQGRGSMDIFRGEGFPHVVPPDHNMKGNPEIMDRVRGANARICSAAKERLVFLDPVACKMTIESISRWKTMPNGTPSRHSKHAHGGDALTYGIWRFFPRRSGPGKLDITAIKRFGDGERGGDRYKYWR